MNKLKKTVINPMTLIAILASLSETSAAISLPFLDSDDRDCYVWFLIGFPFFLSLLFFLTLNFNHRALYSPSEFPKSKQVKKGRHGSAGRRRYALRRGREKRSHLVRLRRGRKP